MRANTSLDGWRSRRRLDLLVLILLAHLAGPALAQQVLKVGVILSKTGPLAYQGVEAEAAIRLAVGSARTAIQIVTFDDQSNADAAAMGARKLIAEHQVSIIVGPTSVASATALLTLKDVPVISLAAEPTRGREASEWMFRVGTTEGHLMVAAQAFIGRDRNAKRLGTVGISKRSMPDPSLKGAFRAFELLGRVEGSVDDLQRTAGQLAGADAIYFSLREYPLFGDRSKTAAAVIPVLRRDPGLSRPQIVAGSLYGVGAFDTTIDSNAYAVVVHDQFTEDGRRFYQAYSKAQKSEPSLGYGARAYSSIQIVEQAWGKAEARPDKLKAALVETRFSTILGPITLKSGEGCSALPLAIRKLDVPRSLIRQVTGNACTCNDSGCCKSCCDNQKKPCNKEETCSS